MGSLVDRFYLDLCREVAALTGDSEAVVGFRDKRSIDIGEVWSDRLASAINSCDYFIALCSSAYFSSEFCGKEWALFDQRVQLMKKSTSEGLPAILPVIWTPAQQKPACVQPLQQWHEAFGNLYREHGLRYLRKIKRHRDEYKETVARLAARVAAQPKGQSIPPLSRVPSFGDIVSAFSHPDAAKAGMDATSTPRGPRFVHVVLVVGTRSELVGLPAPTDVYGAKPHDWRPFLPESSARIAARAQAIAAEQDLLSEVKSKDGLPELSLQASRANELLVVLLDPWTATLTEYRDLLRKFDEHVLTNTAVLVAYATDREPPKQQPDVVRQAIAQALPHCFVRSDFEVFRCEVHSDEQFVEELRDVLMVVQQRLIKLREVMRVAEGPGPVARPILATPVGQSYG